MKKLVAIALVMLMLLGLASACAESTGSTLSMSDISVSYTEKGRTRTARLKGMSLSMALGSAEGVPTLQTTFDSGKGQVVDAIFQIVGTNMLVSVGGISGTFFIDLESISTREGGGSIIANSLSSLFTLAGPHLDVLLYVVTKVDANGVRFLEVPLPSDMYVAVAQSVLGIIEGMENVDETDVDELMERVEDSEDRAVFRFAFDEKAGTFTVSATRGGSGMQVAGNMTLTVEPMVFVNISADEERYDLLNLDEDKKSEVRSELGFILTKFGAFSRNIGLGSILK